MLCPYVGIVAHKQQMLEILRGKADQALGSKVYFPSLITVSVWYVKSMPRLS